MPLTDLHYDFLKSEAELAAFLLRTLEDTSDRFGAEKALARAKEALTTIREFRQETNFSTQQAQYLDDRCAELEELMKRVSDDLAP